MFKSYKWVVGLDGLDWILLRSLVQLEHLAVLIKHLFQFDNDNDITKNPLNTMMSDGGSPDGDDIS